MNTELRKKPKNDLEKDLYKIMVNAGKNYGKCKEAERY